MDENTPRPETQPELYQRELEDLWALEELERLQEEQNRTMSEDD